MAYDLLPKQSEYTRYIADSAELQGVNLSVLGKREKCMFFLNVYQVNLIIRTQLGNVLTLFVQVSSTANYKRTNWENYFSSVGYQQVIY